MILAQQLGKKYLIVGHAPANLREAILSELLFWKRIKRFQQEHWACRNLNFTINTGEAVGIIGKNGAGKSTLLKLLSRITKPTEGRVVLEGRVASLLEVGTGFHPELTGRENIYLNGSLLGMTRKEISLNFQEIVDFSGVSKFVDTPIKHYSSGMRVRLAFAVAAHLNAEILLIDEVLAVGDSEFQSKCIKKMKSITNTGRTILFVSHNLAVVRNLCKRSILLENGKITFDGNTNECITRYLKDQSINSSNIAYFEPDSSKPMCIRSVELLFNSGGLNTLHYGDSLTIKVAFSNSMGMTPYLGFVIKNTDGANLINANNRYQVSGGKHDSGATYVDCYLETLTLMKGEYVIDFYLGDSAVDYHKLQNAISFKVVERDIWRNGVLPPRNASYLWWPVKFNFGE